MLSNRRFFGNAGRSRWTAGSGFPAYAGALQDWTRTEVAIVMPKTMGVPVGYGGEGLALPRAAGSLSSRGVTTITLTATGNASRGLDVAGSAAISIGAVGDVFGVGSVAGIAGIVLGTLGNVYGQAEVAGVAGISIGASGDIGGVAYLSGSANIVLTASSTMGCTAVVGGTAYLSAAAEGVTLTESGIANAVWQFIIEAGLSSADVMRLYAAYVAGDATGLDTAPTFKSIDGSKTRLAGTLSGGARTVTTRDPT